MRRSNSSSARTGCGLSLIARDSFLFGLLEYRRADHPGKQPAPALLDARLELELLAHAVYSRVDIGNPGFVRLSGLPDIDAQPRAWPQPSNPGRRNEHLRLERPGVNEIDKRLSQVHALGPLDAQAGNVAVKRCADAAVRELRLAQRHLAARPVRGRSGDRHLELAGRAKSLQPQAREVRLARRAILRGGGIELRLLLRAIEFDQGSAFFDLIAEPDADVADLPRHLAR